MRFEEAMEGIARLFEVAGVVVIIIGGLHALWAFLTGRLGKGNEVYEGARRTFGRPLILGLEILVAADIIFTITVDPSPESVLILGILVLVRVLLSLALDVEVGGMFPWRRAAFERIERAPATRDAGRSEQR